MGTPRVALALALALALAGCAPAVVGGRFESPGFDSPGWHVDAIGLEFLDASRVRVSVTQARATAVPQCVPQDASTVRQWFVNSEGAIIVNVATTCVLEIPGCGDACSVLSRAISAGLSERSPQLLIARESNVYFNRR